MKSSEVARLTVSLPAGLVDEIDRREKNRSRFVAEAVRREVERRRLEDLLVSLREPHPESTGFADLGLGDWLSDLPEEDAEALLDPRAGRAVRWTPGVGWSEEKPE